jgi:cytochrome b pre-mRNA-processing protein 3
MLARLFGRSRDQDAASALYGTLVARAREPVFYAALGVPDSLDGRFDMIALHAFLVMHRLKREPGAGDLAQALFDYMFGDMDRSLREMGVGDLGVGKRVKEMVAAFYGRVAAYQEALDADGAGLTEALARNLYRGAAPSPEALAEMAAYTRAQAAALAAQPMAALAAGKVAFGPLPAASATAR